MAHERKPTILLVEDSPDEEKLVSRAVTRAKIPCDLVVAHTTDEALDYLFSRGKFAGREPANPDVVVTDLRINSIGGAELITAIRQAFDTHLIPIVVLTGSADRTMIEDLYLRGANSFLEKPIDFDDFATTVIQLARYWGMLNRSTAMVRETRSFPYPL